MTRPPRFLPSTTSLRRDLFSLVRSYGSRLQKPRRPTPPPHPCSPKMRGSNPVWPERNLKKLSSQLILKNQKWWTHSLSESTSGTSRTEKVLRVPLPSASIVPILSALTDFICLQVQTQRQTQTKVFNKLITSFIHWRMICSYNKCFHFRKIWNSRKIIWENQQAKIENLTTKVACPETREKHAIAAQEFSSSSTRAIHLVNLTVQKECGWLIDP